VAETTGTGTSYGARNGNGNHKAPAEIGHLETAVEKACWDGNKRGCAGMEHLKWQSQACWDGDERRGDGMGWDGMGLLETAIAGTLGW